MADAAAPMPGRRWSRLATFLIRHGLPAFIIAAAIAAQFGDVQFRARIRDNAFDSLQALAPLPYRDELPVRVVALDDASLATLGQWPWPRTVLAGIINKLVDMGARVVALDLILSEPDRTSPEQVAAFFPDQRDLQKRLLRLPTHDKLLAKSFTRGKVVVGFPIIPGASSAPLPPARAHFPSFGGDAKDWLPRYGGGLASLPVLTEAAAGSGAISLEPDSDGVLRAMPLLHHVRDVLYPSLGLEALRLYLGADNLALQIVAADTRALGQVPGIQGISLGSGVFQATAPDGRVWLRYRRLASERYLSAQDVLSGKIDATQIKDHVVFFGATAKGLGDTIHSPLGELIPGVEGHVQLVEQLLAGDLVLRPVWENDVLILLLLGMWLVLSVLLNRARPAWSILLTALVIAGLMSFSFWLFVTQQTLLDPIYPTLAVTLLFIVMTLPRYLQTESDQRWIRDAFSRYVSPNRVAYLQANPQNLELGGVYRECSFVMTDLAGFTTLMEKHDSALLSTLLNDYLDGMIQIAFRHDGTLDRIVGDAVAVMFSAPIQQPDHAARALACALEMDGFANGFSAHWQAQGIPFGRTRIGVNTGTVLVGNFGGKSMLDYRALGDAINTAARLETVNGQIGTRICVSGTTVAQCPDFIGRPIGQLVLKGKSEPVAAFEPLSAEQHNETRITEYRAAYALMDAETAEADETLRVLAEKYPDDPLIAYHRNRYADGSRGSRVVLKSK